MTDQHNTSVSAIGVLTNSPKVALDVYHNKYAHIPLDPRELSAFGIRQFRLAQTKRPNEFYDWEEMTNI